MPRTQQTIAVITQKTLPMQRKMQQGMADFAAGHPDWHLEFINAVSPSADNLDRRRLAGIIFTGSRNHIMQRTRRWKIPQACIAGDRQGIPTGCLFPVICTDNAAIGRMAAEHLRQHGYQHLAFYRLPNMPYNIAWAQDRQNAFMDHPVKSAMIMPNRICLSENVLRVTTKWLEQLPLPVGIMAANDEHARTLLEACRLLKLDVPRQVAVIGVDNDEFFCKLTEPHLSSVIQNAERSGYEAARLIEQQMRGKPTPKLTLMPPAGIAIRQSTDCLALNDPVMLKAVEFIRGNYARDIGTTEVAAAAGVSRASLDNLARRLLGQTIHTIISGERLRRARELLEQTEIPIKQVAEQAGFTTVQYLNAVFKRHTNSTPGDYRTNHRYIGVDRHKIHPENSI